MKTTIALTLISLAATRAITATAQSFNLANDWSDISNPNGPWAYTCGGIPLSSTERTSDTWSTPQVSWGDLPGWFKSNGTEQFAHDWVQGDVITHTGSSEIRWTSPVSGSVNILGGIWATRDISGRFNDWTISLNGAPLASGTVGAHDPYDRATPFLFSTGAGGASALTNLGVNVGDVVVLSVNGHGNVIQDYARVDLTVNVTAVPEPKMLAFIAALGLSAFAVFRRVNR